MRIGELSERTGVDKRLLRYYEQQDLLHPTRAANGYRVYREDDVALVVWIRRLLAAGLPTSAITQFLACAVDDGRRPADGECRHLYERLLAERERIDAAITGLETNRARLDAVIAGGSTR